ncbi:MULTISPECIES: alpha/beta hydrolase [Microbacterium]|uniref:Alpha/beta hydrolase n=2 Tax=Microbacterium maritypicum TaxID=33918 RepID=A0AAJ6AQK5_MICMQ|nr:MULTISPECIES: alpha/beta hydrolase [Microbacterium]EYT58458.1 hydrolase [Microbacterium sp. UCD-TDU]MBP5802812.1 alpha/beta hydrolase [Microbacterium liquefaciens]UTT54186.1 alpha/beta hydrolase [Microbacterium liquefaciens]WEF22148.1 alpha/beta hydrolase [Microbacterium liquefaciens]
MQKKRGRRILKRVLWSVAIVLVLAVGGVLAWSQIGVMAAEPEQLAAVRENPAITVTDADEGIVLAPADGASERGLVFIPGAKVDPWAYAAILQGLAEDGVTVVITRPWLNLAFFDPRGLDAFTAAVPDVDVWSVGGHSLGGVRACQLAADADALVLFASYCANDLSESGLPVLSLSGSEDGLSTPEKIADARDQLPADADMVEIDGASHASFGDYGPQDGDGTPTISREQMHAEVTRLTESFLAPLAP